MQTCVFQSQFFVIASEECQLVRSMYLYRMHKTCVYVEASVGATWFPMSSEIGIIGIEDLRNWAPASGPDASAVSGERLQHHLLAQGRVSNCVTHARLIQYCDT